MSSLSPLAVHSAGRRAMLLAAACFVANVLLIRALGGAGADVLVIVSLRFAAGLALCLLTQRTQLDARALFTHPRLIARGVIGGACTYAFYVTVVQLGAGRAVFLNYTYVILAALLALPLLGEAFRRPLALGACAAFIGLGLLTEVFFGTFTFNRYDALGLLAALGSAWIVVAIRQLTQEHLAPATIFAAQCIYGLLLCAPFFVFGERHWPSAATCLGLVAAGLCAAIGQLAMTRAYRDLTVAEGSLLQTLVPLGTALGGMLFFHESLGLHGFIGGVLIVAGSALPLMGRR